MEDITGGTVHIKINAAGLPLDLDPDLCEALSAVGINGCHLPKGREQKLEVNTFIPSLGFSVSVLPAQCYC